MLKENELLKSKVKNIYSELVRSGDFASAVLILRFLRKGEITLGLSDACMKVEDILNELGCILKYTNRYYLVRAYLMSKNN